VVKTGIIINPKSHKNQKGLSGLRESIAGRGDISHAVIESVDEIPDILRDFARREIGLLVCVAGDGTMQAILTGIFGERPFDAPPLLAVLPGGRTNMIAADVGVRHRNGRGLADLLARAASDGLARHAVERRVLRIDGARDAAPLYGMFFGSAGICRAMEFCRARLHPYNIRSDLASAATIAGLVGRLMWNRGGNDAIGGGDEIDIALDDREIGPRSCLFLLATTLDRLILRSRPYWNDAGGSLHVTYLTHPATLLGFHVLRVLYGGSRRNLPEDRYISQDAEIVRLRMNCRFTLDGEYFDVTDGQDLILSGSDRARFIRL